MPPPWNDSCAVDIAAWTLDAFARAPCPPAGLRDAIFGGATASTRGSLRTDTCRRLAADAAGAASPNPLLTKHAPSTRLTTRPWRRHGADACGVVGQAPSGIDAISGTARATVPRVTNITRSRSATCQSCRATPARPGTSQLAGPSADEKVEDRTDRLHKTRERPHELPAPHLRCRTVRQVAQSHRRHDQLDDRAEHDRHLLPRREVRPLLLTFATRARAFPWLIASMTPWSPSVRRVAGEKMHARLPAMIATCQPISGRANPRFRARCEIA